MRACGFEGSDGADHVVDPAHVMTAHRLLVSLALLRTLVGVAAATPNWILACRQRRGHVAPSHKRSWRTVPPMSRYDELMVRARVGEPVLIDGATGSECARRGVPWLELGWSGGAALSHPEIVRSIHDDYLAIGADLIASNTFATGANILRDVGNEADFEALNRAAVELAVAARDGAGSSAVVAGGISNWSFAGEDLDLARLHADTLAQARIMRDAGADLLSLEMMVDLPRYSATLDAASSVGLPVWVGFSVGGDLGHDPDELGDDIQLRDGGRLAEAIEVAAANDAVGAVCIMHTDIRLIEPCLAFTAARWSGPLGAYGHASAVIDGVHTHDGVITPEEYAAKVGSWQQAGATMIGGCCGIGPDHLRLVAEALGLGGATRS